MKPEHSPRLAALAPLLRRDLARYAQHEPVDYDVDRGLERLTASLALAGAAGGGGASAATGFKALATKAIGLMTLPASKAVAILLFVGAAGTVAGLHISRREPAPVAPALGTSAPPPAIVAPHVQVERPAPAEPTTTPPAALAPTALHKTPARVVTLPRTERRGATRDAELREEMAALVHLREVASRDPAAAVTLAAQDDARYGKGDLYGEEREVIAVTALARGGRKDEARARGGAFLALHPKSPFATLVRGALAP